ncbi:putative ribonuclease H-like domain-containing protein [Tanacetum coccineum]
MQEELLQFKLQNVWVLVDLPKGHRAIGTKWVYRNKKDKRGIVVRNKARLSTIGCQTCFLYGQIEEEDLEKPLVKDADADDVDEHLYRSMIGSLMYYALDQYI